MSRVTTTATTAPPARHRGRPARLLSLLAVTVALFAAVASSSEENEPDRVDEGSGSAATTEAGGSGTGSDDQGNEGDGGGSDQPEVFAVGDLVELGDWQVKVHGVTDPVVSDDDLFQPPAGQRWVAVDVEVTNTGDQAETVSSALCFELMDDTNTTYMQTVTGMTSAATPDGDVAPGASLRGTVEYELPAGAAGLKLNFSCDLLAPGTATIALGG